ncbi:hypothetical protein [Rhodopirellula baltica]|uniref:Uncharacterized protein n=1 Tax=Rhodopirellula baltica WH47 TaxID=991778 RepID=F2AR49_RHOBT|nr:hypothetical protein [Rhodopirellula baltica]EGF27857.1 conserved hypothetical protein, membrane [Rhodopirellula baltica WH47]
MSLDKFRQAWKADASQLKVTIDIELLTQQVQQSDDQFRTMIFWRDVREVGVSLLLIPVWLVLGIGFSLPWSWWLTVPVLLWIAGFMLIDRKRHPKASSDPGQPLLFYTKESLTQVEHQIWLLRNVFWWYLLPPTISLMAFFVHLAWNLTGTWWGCILVATPFGVFLFYTYRKIYRLNQAAVDEQLQPRQEHLRRIVETLESEDASDAAEVDELVELVSSLAENDPKIEGNPGAAEWFENWNRIVPSWWIAGMILLPTLMAACSGYRFAFDKAGPVFFQSVVMAVIVFEIMFFGRWYLISKRYKGQPSTGENSKRLEGPAIVVLITLLVVSALAFAAIFSFVTHASSKVSSDAEVVSALDPPVNAGMYARIAPFTDVRWKDDLPTVCVAGDWSQLKSIDGIPADQIMSFASEQYGSLARKRFTEDLVELLSKMGHDVGWEVELNLQFPDGHVETVRERMTAVNRRVAGIHLQIRTQYNLSKETPDATE